MVTARPPWPGDIWPRLVLFSQRLGKRRGSSQAVRGLWKEEIIEKLNSREIPVTSFQAGKNSTGRERFRNGHLSFVLCLDHVNRINPSYL